jgi:TRAP-type C4-dicarboxylate transport system permease small subunit
MFARLRYLGAWLHRRAENILAAMLGLMFAVFILQIVFRYLLNLPIGWTHEISVMLWVWLVLFGTAFVVRDYEEIRFDLLYGTVGDRAFRVMAVVTAIIVIGLFAVSLPAVIDYVQFMKVEKTAYLKLRFDYLYIIYPIFAVVVIIRQFWVGCQAIWGKQARNADPTKVSSGV